MRRDWVIWLGCGTLFFAGVIWGGIPKGAGFFKISNIHDAAETLAALATVFGVCLAVIGYNSWRDQVVAESDHDLSKRASIALQKYKPFALKSFVLANRLVSRMYQQLGYGGSPDGLLDNVRSQLKQLQDAHSEMRFLAQECRHSWGEEVWDVFSEVFSVVDNCQNCTELFVRWSDVTLSDQVRDRYSASAINSFEFVRIFIGDNVEAVETCFEERYAFLVKEFKARKLN